jgi:hypothetical protein
MITVLLYIFVCLFGLKILWNLIVPYELARRAWKGAGPRTSGISIMPLLEISLLLLAIGAAAWSGGGGWFHSPKDVALWGGLVVIISYVHLLIASRVAGWVVSRLKKG